MTSRSIDRKRAALLAILSDRCFLCDGSYLEANPVVLHKIFDKRAKKFGQTKHATLSDVLTSAIGRQFDQGEVHSSILCGNCYNNVVEYERFEQQLEESRQRILNAYQQTIKHYVSSQAHNNDIRHSADESSEYFVESINIEETAIEYCPVDDDEHEVAEQEEEAKELEEGNDGEEETLLDIDVVDATSNSKVDNATDTENTDDLTGVEFLLDDTDDMNAKSGEEDVAISNDLVEPTSQCQSTSDSATDHNRCSTNVVGNSRKSVKQLDDSEIVLEDHILFLRDDDRFKCQVCEVSQWQILTDFTLHMEKSHKNRIGACPLCREVFFSMDKLDEHIDKDHNDVTSFECSECRRIFSSYRLLEKHARTHEVHAKQYNYDICRDKCSNKNTLILHISNSHTNTNVKSYKCNECCKVFATNGALKNHMNLHKEQPVQFQCDECDGVFAKKYSLTQHKKLHVKTKDFICKVCSKSFTTQHYLDVHSIVHSGERPYVCGTCGKRFARSGDMKDHERIHTGERPFKCDICDMAFAQRSNLMSHMKSTHLNQRLHKCTQCNRSFKRRRLLDYHVRSQHTGERPHVCETCGASFVYPDHLKKHKIIHTGKRPFACEVCGKQFNSRENRNSHHFVHSDKKPYECVDCGAGFMRKPQLFYHLQQYKHSDDTIILNQPQLKKGIVSKIVPNDANIQYINDNEDEDNTLESIILDDEAIVEEIDESATVKSNDDILDDNVSEIKYLELDEENTDAYTWAIMKDNE